MAVQGHLIVADTREIPVDRGGHRKARALPLGEMTAVRNRTGILGLVTGDVRRLLGVDLTTRDSRRARTPTTGVFRLATMGQMLGVIVIVLALEAGAGVRVDR